MATRTLPYPSPADSSQYASDLLTELGAPSPIPPNELAVTTAWVDAESKTFPGWNGLGTTLELPGSTPVPGNPDNVQLYPSLQEGLDAAVDMMEGLSPQTTALAPQFVGDVQGGKASPQQLIADIQASGWDGSGGDTYDASTIAAELNPPNTAESIQTTSFWGGVEHYVNDALPGSDQIITGITDPGKEASNIAGSVLSGGASGWQSFVLTALVAVAGGGLVILGVYKAAGGGQNGHPLVGAAAKTAVLA